MTALRLRTSRSTDMDFDLDDVLKLGPSAAAPTPTNVFGWVHPSRPGPRRSELQADLTAWLPFRPASHLTAYRPSDFLSGSAAVRQVNLASRVTPSANPAVRAFALGCLALVPPKTLTSCSVPTTAAGSRCGPFLKGDPPHVGRVRAFPTSSGLLHPAADRAALPLQRAVRAQQILVRPVRARAQEVQPAPARGRFGARARRLLALRRRRDPAAPAARRRASPALLFSFPVASGIV